MQVPPLTHDLINRIERHLARGVVLDPDGATYAVFGQTVCQKAAGGRPRNKVFGFGKADLDQLGRVVAFYGHDRLEPTFYLTPANFCDEVATALSHMGFVQREFGQAILYGVPLATPPTTPAEISIEPVTRDNIDDFARTMGLAHDWDQAWREAAVRDVRDKFLAESAQLASGRHRFIVRVAGEPVAVGGLSLRDGIASLGAGGVIPLHRCRGLHLALLQHRLHLAHQLRAELIVSGASVASVSFRNQQRSGLQIAYIESGWRRA